MKLLLVEAEQKLAEWLGKALGNGGYAVDTIAAGRNALSCLGSEGYDAAILDLSLPDLDGLEVLRRARRAGSTLPIIVVSARDGPDNRVKGLALGADDYLSKPVDFAELDARIRALIRRVKSHGRQQVSCGPLCYDTTERALFLNGEQLNLPPKEHSVLEMLMINYGRTVRKEVMHQRTYGFDSYTSPNAIEVYIHRLRRRLAATGVTIVTLRGFGYAIKPLQ
jgi:two-component system response regulator TctD